MRVFPIFLCVALCGLPAWLCQGASPPSSPSHANKSAATSPAVEVELFAGMKSGELDVQIIHTDQSREAKIRIKNNGKDPVAVKLPAAFAAVPVLAQIGQGGGGFGQGGGGQGGGGQNQNSGGGIGGGGQGGGGGGGGIFNIAPEKVGELKVAMVCLNHGLREPNAYIKYEMKPLAEVNSDPHLEKVLIALANDKVSQRVAQAATWHFANDMSWEELNAKKINRLGRADDPYYKPGELRAAAAFANIVEQAVAEEAKTRAKSKATESTGESTTEATVSQK